MTSDLLTLECVKCPYMAENFQVLGYPSKPIGLFIRRSIIFRSDSNGEDLEGYAGAGLYDRYLSKD